MHVASRIDAGSRRPARLSLGVLGAAVALVIVAQGVSSFRDGPRFDVDDVRASALAPAAPAFVPMTELNRLIGVFEGRVSESPNSVDLRYLGALYLDRARATGDPRDLSLGQATLDRAMELSPHDIASALLLASSLQSLHRFAEAESIATDVLAVDAANETALLLAADVMLATGDYENAFRTYEVLYASIGEHPAVLVRRAEVAHLQGRNGEAVELATAAAAQIPLHRKREAAYYAAIAAQLSFEAGDMTIAREQADRAAALDPDNPAVLATLARVTAADGAIETAIDLYEAANVTVPQPAYLAELGDLYLLAGRPGDAQATYETLGVVARRTPDLHAREIALFEAGQQQNPQRAVTITTQMLDTRPDIDGWDVHAWALLSAGDLEAARTASDHALSLGTRSAPLLYHSGAIWAALGEVDRARADLVAALEINGFSPLDARDAAGLLTQLEAPDASG